MSIDFYRQLFRQKGKEAFFRSYADNVHIILFYQYTVMKLFCFRLSVINPCLAYIDFEIQKWFGHLKLSSDTQNFTKSRL